MNGTRNVKRKELDMVTLLTSIVVGVIGCIISGFVYGIIKEIMWKPLAVGISFMLFAFVYILAMVILSFLNGNLGLHFRKHKDGGMMTLALAGIILLTFVLGLLFEFLYEIDMFSEQDIYQDATSYVFIIDNSGSMSGNDPDGLRYSAISRIMAEKDDSFPYAVYSFSDSVVVDRAIAPISDGNNELGPKYLGGTSLKLALTTVLDEYENKFSYEMGDAPKFLVLSDGYATDIGLFRKIDPVLKRYAKTNISVSTVGLGNPDEALMQRIADETGGVYINVDDVDSLEDSMKQAITKYGEDKYARTLYTRRSVPRLNFVYAIMRILFTSILGVLMSLAMLFATGKSEDSSMIIGSSLITGAIAGILMESGINLLGIAPGIIRLLYFALVASTFITTRTFSGVGSRGLESENEIDYDVRKRLKFDGNSKLTNGNNSNFGNSYGSGSQSFDSYDFDDYYD